MKNQLVVHKNKNLNLFLDFRTGFKNSINLIDLAFLIDKPISRPQYDCDGTIYGYDESVPIHVHAIDQPNITAEKMLWKAR